MELIYGFNVPPGDGGRHYADAALLVYAAWRSREQGKLKVTPKLWDTVTGMIEASAYQSRTIGQFVGKFCAAIGTGSLKPKACQIGVAGNRLVTMEVQRDQWGDVKAVIERAQPERRQFLTEVVWDMNDKAVLRLLKTEAMLVVTVVRDRLEREKPFENELDALAASPVAETETAEVSRV
jgi:hypothetical protein